MQIDALIEGPTEVLRGPNVPVPVVLKSEREKRRYTREEVAERVGVKLNYYRHIENGAVPSQEVKDAIRVMFSECPVCRDLGVKCTRKLPVPPDDELYAPPKK
jgi:DNA-binding XRE family transcriptional regulator